MVERARRRIILIVEDNDDDFEAVESAFGEVDIFEDSIVRCASGQDALDFLTAQGAYRSRCVSQRPALILLDLNLLGVTGRDVLTRIKNDERMCVIPVIVMTSSTDDRDIDACYKAGANAYLQKPMELERLFKSISRLKDFWLESAVLPKAD